MIELIVSITYCTRLQSDALQSITCLTCTLTLSPGPCYQRPPSPLLERANQPKAMPRVTAPDSESESERVPSKKQKKTAITVDDPMDEDGEDEGDGEEEEYEIERILDSSTEIFEDVCFTVGRGSKEAT